jgi:hypothetical protein
MSKQSMAKQREMEMAWLDQWFEISGMTMAELIQEIERCQPGNSGNPLDRMGIGRDLHDSIRSRGLPDNWNGLRVLRAVQTLVCERPWLRANTVEPDLFAQWADASTSRS